MTLALLVLLLFGTNGKSPAVFCFWLLLSKQDSNTAGARERRNEKKTSLCFRVGKGALAVNLLAFVLLASALVVGMEGLCFASGFACGFTHLLDVPMALCLTRYLLLF